MMMPSSSSHDKNKNKIIISSYLKSIEGQIFKNLHKMDAMGLYRVAQYFKSKG